MATTPASLRAMAGLCAAMLLAAFPTFAQGTTADAARRERMAANFEAEATVLTMLDREGTLLGTFGERGMNRHPVLSPDGKRIAVIRADLFNEVVDIWTIDIESGEETRITSHGSWDSEWPAAPLWSPDSSQLAYVGMRDGYEGVYRKAANGEGPEELLYRHSGAEVFLGDWSTDGRYASLSTSNLGGGNLYVLPMTGTGERPAVEILRSDRQLIAGSFSPDSRLLSYMSDLSGIAEVYVRTVDLDAGSQKETTARQVSGSGGKFAIRAGWSPARDELYYMAADQSIVAARISGSGVVERTPLFRLSQAVRASPGFFNISRDGERILMAAPQSPKLEQVTVFDREGTILQRLGEPGVYRNPAPSPDGKRVAVTTRIAESGNLDIWTFDLASGTHTAVTDDVDNDNWPVWSPDGSELAYRKEHGIFTRIYRRAIDGPGNAKEVFEYTPGAGLQVTDWSADGQYIAFNDGCWGVLYVVPSDNSVHRAEGKAMEWLRDEYQVAQARFSPDGRYIAYLADETVPDLFQIYVSRFNPDQPDGHVADATPIQVSSDGVLGMVSWRGDGKELYYLTTDWEVMAIDVSTVPVVKAGTPKLLFKLPGPLPGNPKQWKSVTPDGERFAFVLYVPASITVPR